MKKAFAFILVFLFVVALCGCNGVKDTGGVPKQSEAGEEVFTSPPKLKVVCGDESVEALKGTSSWTYKNPDGTSVSVISDSMHPLDAKEYMTPLRLLPTYKSSVDPLKAYLLFESDPDKVEVRVWNENAWGKPDSEYEITKVEVSDSEMADRTGRRDYCFRLNEGAFIYEVTAEWTSREMYGGKAYYSFYTTSPKMTVYPIDNAQKQ